MCAHQPSAFGKMGAATAAGSAAAAAWRPD
jgi:hypothetical protein